MNTVAVFFDLDGVLVDTQAAELQALEQLVRQQGGGALLESVADAVNGIRMQDAINLVCDAAQIVPPADALAQVRRLTERLLAGRTIRIEGIAEALSRIGHPKYVVSNSPLELIERRLAQARIERHFPGPHFSAYELNSWKPAPDLYRAALSTVAVPARNVIAIEDSKAGVESARLAGLRVYWYQPRKSGETHLAASVTTFVRIAELPEMLDHDLLHRPLMHETLFRGAPTW